MKQAEEMERNNEALRERLAGLSQANLRINESLCVLGDLTVGYPRRRVTLAGRRVPLTDTEYRLLVELSIDPGTPVTYNDLLHRVWGLESSSDRRTLRSTVKSIRRQLGDEARNPA